MKTRILYIVAALFSLIPFAASATTWTAPTDGTIPVTITVTGADFVTHNLCVAILLEGQSDPWSRSNQSCLANAGASSAGSCEVSQTVGTFDRVAAWDGTSDCSDVYSWPGYVEGTTIQTYDPPIVIGESATTSTPTATSTTDLAVLSRTLQYILLAVSLIIFIVFGWLGFRLSRS